MPVDASMAGGPDVAQIFARFKHELSEAMQVATMPRVESAAPDFTHQNQFQPLVEDTRHTQSSRDGIVTGSSRDRSRTPAREHEQFEEFTSGCVQEGSIPG